MNRRYAEGTAVAPHQTRAQIETRLSSFGCTELVVGYSGVGARARGRSDRPAPRTDIGLVRAYRAAGAASTPEQKVEAELALERGVLAAIPLGIDRLSGCR